MTWFCWAPLLRCLYKFAADLDRVILSQHTSNVLGVCKMAKHFRVRLNWCQMVMKLVQSKGGILKNRKNKFQVEITHSFIILYWKRHMEMFYFLHIYLQIEVQIWTFSLLWVLKVMHNVWRRCTLYVGIYLLVIWKYII